MLTYLFKPFGADNYLILTNPDEIAEFFDKLVPGDEFVIRCAEFSDDEYEKLQSFTGFGGPTETGGTAPPQPEAAPAE
jgi:hypothetical protein